MIEIMSYLLNDIPGVTRSVSAGTVLFRQGDKVSSMFQINDGEVRLVRNSKAGGSFILQRAHAGSILAEASLFSTVYHCDAIVGSDTTLKSMSRASLRRKFESDPAFAKAWAIHLASEIRTARQRAEILSLRTIAERLSAWIDTYGKLPQKGDWKQLAQEIGTSPEALYRELAKNRF